jgi:biopolymer transport protein ExbB
MTLLTLLLLQGDTPAVAAQTVASAIADSEKLSVFYLLREGGVLMIPLLLCSVVLVYFFVERFMAIRKAGRLDSTFMLRIRDHVASGNLQAARSLAQNTQSPIARMIEKGLSRIGKPIDHIEKSMESTGKLAVYQLEKNLPVISSIARIAPMFGFLGTLAGMIILFFNIQHQGFKLESFAGGIYTKMVTSAVGLIIGLVAYVAYDYLNTQINKIVNKMESAATDFLDMLQEPAHT